MFQTQWLQILSQVQREAGAHEEAQPCSVLVLEDGWLRPEMTQGCGEEVCTARSKSPPEISDHVTFP